ncbi:MAG: molybdopterin-dependent oxidoreductase [Flavisolibacter sp.]|nr:molybdopterin-dependent oxidoreductase [Flavisolibacter sp.]
MKQKSTDTAVTTTTTSVNFVNIDAAGHVTGKSIYVDDVPLMEGTLYAKIFDSPVAHGVIKNIDYSGAEKMEGVVKIFSAHDIPGENEIGGIVHDEPLLAENEVYFQGQPILIIVAETEDAAEEALKGITIEIDPLPVVTDPKEAFHQNLLLSKSRTFQKGDTTSAFAQCKYIFEGEAETGGQEHLYLETQGAYAYPLEQDFLKIYSSTQGLRHVQETVAAVLGVGMHKIEVDTTRLGGGFGGKEDQAAMWASAAGLAAWILKKPVKCVPHRMEDMRMTGKRNPYKADYKIGVDDEYNIIAYEATYYQNGGAAADLSPAILERTLFHGTNSYAIPHVKLTAHSCKTNLPPNTAFRGFGGPQGMFMVESAIDHAAKALLVDAAMLQRKNIMSDGYEFSYGQVVADSKAEACWDDAVVQYDLDKIKADVDTFNNKNVFDKKGISLMPVCFGISFTNTMMNQARALVHVYWDGTVSVSTGAVEMGQGVNTKMLQVAAKAFGINPSKIKIETTNTTRVANTSPSAASATADLNGKALQIACDEILERLTLLVRNLFKAGENDAVSFVYDKIFINGIETGMHWEELVQKAFAARINLSSKGHYATPVINFDKSIEKGHPFAYHVYGTAITVVTVDCVRGTYEFDAVHVVHDCGTSINTAIDLGQCEGGLVQGMGWMTMEDVVYNQEGKLLSNALSTYKIPDIYSVPKEINFHFLDTEGSEMAIEKSKAVGEPPLMYGIGAFFAIRNAMLAFNSNAIIPYTAPMTPEKVLMGLYSNTK